MTDPITITSGELRAAIPALQEILALKPKAKIGFQIQRAMKQVQNELEALSFTIKEMGETHTLKDESGTPVQAVDAAGNVIEGSFKLRDPKAYTDEMTELMEDEIKLAITPIHIDTVKDLEISISTLTTLDWLFTE